MAIQTHPQRLFSKPTHAARTALLLATAALLLLSLAPQTLANGKGGSGHGGSRGHHGGHHGNYHGNYRGNHHYSGSHHRVYLGIGYPYFGYGYGYGYSYPYGYYGHYGAYPYAYGAYGYRRTAKFGAIDLNVKPKDTQVWVNGGYVGTTGKLDGSPSMLWLEKASYEVIFFKEGYETQVRKYTVTPGGVIKERFQMQPGESKRPEDLSTAAPMPPPRADAAPQERVERRVIERRPRERPAPRQEPNGTLDVRKEPGQLAVHVTPKDASVYLDGDFIGTAKDLRQNPVLLVDPGEHRVEIVHPAYESQKVEITVEAGKAGEIEVNLAKKLRADV